MTMAAGSAVVTVLVGAVSVLYAMAGQAGGTGFIAVMAITGFPADDRSILVSYAALIGTGAGLLAGLTGVGGGVFFAPVLILCGWASPERVANLSAPFILANSVLGFAGTVIAGESVSSDTWLYAVAALIGAATGGIIRLRWMSGSAIRIVLAVLLIIAGCRLILV